MGHQVDVFDILARIQNYIYPRRPRIKENFTDYDPLRAGTVSVSRFIRAVSSIGVSGLKEPEIECVAHYFKRPNGDVDYIKFVAAVDSVFGPQVISDDPTDPIPSSGQTVRPMFCPAPAEDEDKLHAVMHRVSLLAKTRGVVMKYAFQDFDRGDCASLIAPRRGGKVTTEVFLRTFPFRDEFSPEEIQMIIDRYSVDGTLINYMALHDDVTDRSISVAVEELPRSEYIAPDLSTVKWTHDEISVVERIQARVVERRIRPRDYFQDFDPLKKGYCTERQARTVLSVMNIPVSDCDFEQLCKLYSRPGDQMFHYDAFQEQVDAAFSTKGLEMLPLTRTALPSPDDTLVARENKVTSGFTTAARLPQGCLNEDDAQQYIELLETKIRARVSEQRLPMKTFFQDFDKTSQGHVTSSQFMRVLTNLNFPVSIDDMKLLVAKYCDRGNLRDVNYKEFCRVVDPTCSDITLAEKQSTTAFTAHTSALYFDKTNKVIPAI